MICDYQTNKVYLAEGIKGYPKVAENLLYALYKEGIETEYLPHSKSKKHVWARDYMPIQLEEGREERQGLYSKLRWDDSEAGAELQADVARD